MDTAATIREFLMSRRAKVSPADIGLSSSGRRRVAGLRRDEVALLAGGAAGSLWMSTELHGRVRSSKQLVVVEGAAHMDFYDVPKYVDRAVAEAVPFFTENLAPGSEA